MAKRESEKIEKYQFPCGKLGISFSPIAFDSHGGMGPSTLKTIQEMISLAASKHSNPVETATHMWQRLSFDTIDFSCWRRLAAQHETTSLFSHPVST